MSAVADSAVRDRARIAGAPPSPSIARNNADSDASLSGLADYSSTYRITQPLLIKDQPALAAIVFSLRAAAPAAISSLTLYVLAQWSDASSTDFFDGLTILTTVLAIVLLQPSRNPATDLVAPRGRIALGLLLRWAALLLVLAIIGFATGHLPGYQVATVAIWALATPLLLVPATLALDEIVRRVLCRPQNCRNVVFAGYNAASRNLAQRFSRHSELCMEVKGFFDDRSAQRLDAPTERALLGPLSQLPTFVKSNDIDVIFIALPLRHIRRVHALLDALGDTTVSLYYLPDVFVSDQFQVRVGEILGVPVIAMRESPFYGYAGMAKRLMDIAISSIALLALLPVLLTITLAIRVTSPGPIVFRQRRYGLDGREIVIYKFRTMTVTEDSGWFTQARPDDARVTRIGRFLRRWSLDELPQLINVLQGRMSLVGPRPHAVGHNEEYRRLIKGYMVRHKVPPGITGLAQVKGYRGATPRLQDMQSRVRYDLEYLRNWSLWLDVKILLKTVPILFKTDKAY